MRKILRLVLPLLLILVIAVPASAQTAALFGVVTDQNGQPVAGAEVEVYGLDEGLVQVLRTGYDGSFALGDYEGNALLWQIRVWAKGYRTYESGWFDLIQQRYQSVRLEKLTGDLAVAVRDEAGAAVEGTVTLVGPAGRLVGQFPLAQGQFRRENLEPGQYRVLIGAPGLAPGAQVLTVVPNQTASALIVMAKSGVTASGEVLDITSGDPVSGARVELLRADLTQVASAVTGRDGRFRLAASGELPGTYLVRVSAPDYRSVTTDPFEVSAGQEYSLSGTQAIRLQAVTATLEGELLDEDGDPIDGERVVLLLQGHGEVARDTTDDDGTFRFRDVQAGDEYLYTVLPLVDDLTFNLGWTALTPGATEFMALRGELTADNPGGEGTISGIVTTVDGKPVDDAKVELFQGDNEVDDTETGGNGTFVFDDLDATIWEETDEVTGQPVVELAAPYTIRVTADGYYATRDFFLGGKPAVYITVRDGSTTNIRVVLRPEETDLQGRVIDGRDGHGVAGAQVSLLTDGGITQRTTTDAAGWYKFPDFPVQLVERYSLQVKAPGYLSMTDLDVTEAATSGSSLPTVTLSEDKTTFTGQVLSPTGQPQAQVTVRVQDPNGRILGEGVTDSQGFYQVSTALPRIGNVTLVASKDGWATAVVNLPEPPAAGQTLNQNLAILPNSATLAGRLLDESGLPFTSGQVDLLEEGKGVVAVARTDLLGLFTFRDIDLSDSGWFSLRVTAPGAAFGGSLTHRTALVPMLRLVPGKITLADLLVKVLETPEVTAPAAPVQ